MKTIFMVYVDNRVTLGAALVVSRLFHNMVWSVESWQGIIEFVCATEKKSFPTA